MANKKEKETEQTAVENLNSTLTNAGEKLAANKKVIFWTLGGIAVIAALVISYLFFYRTPHINRAYEAYNQVEIDAAGNDSIAAVKYQKVADANKGNTAGELAALSAAEAFYSQGNYKSAAEYAEKFSSDEPVLDANAKILAGDCYVNLKNYSKALELYKKAISKADGNPQIVPRVLLKEANIYDAQKNYQAAMDCYQQIQDEFPAFQLGNGMTVEAYIEREKARLGK
ncbi:MAG: tetratricopeptide repeat protein [Bacteroidales bacterium]|nr:tetratricopeptide repeat protein [Bacteroidales bacterium]